MKLQTIASIIALALVGCITSTTTTTAPDGTVTKVETQGVDANTVTTVSAAVTALAQPRITVDSSSGK